MPIVHFYELSLQNLYFQITFLKKVQKIYIPKFHKKCRGGNFAGPGSK